jgi:hypothetical protein
VSKDGVAIAHLSIYLMIMIRMKVGVLVITIYISQDKTDVNVMN